MPTLSPQLQSLLDNRLRYLPEIVGRAINHIDWPSELITIGKHYGLHIDEMEDFQALVLKSMIGLLPPEQFESALISTIAVSPKDADKIIHDINEKIFEPIHNFIMHPDKKTDALTTSGIMVEAPQASDEGAPAETVVSADRSTQEFEVPASPEPKQQSKRPVVSFADYF